MIDDPPLSGSHYDRAAARRTEDDWLADAWHRSRVLLVTPGAQTLVCAGRLALVSPSQAPDGPRRFLGSASGVPYFTVTADPDTFAAAGSVEWRSLREFGSQADDLEGGLVVAAVALEQWHHRHTHCPRCGAATAETKAGWTRTCTADASEHFPRTDPAVIMLIVDDDTDRVLLGRGPQWGPGRFSTLAGFVEPGESLEAAVAREVDEEVGVAVRDIRYLASQPWPFPASLMLGFVARLAGDDAITLDPVELAEAGWFTREEVRQAADRTDDGELAADPDRRLQAISPHFSISRFLIDRWLAGSC